MPPGKQTKPLELNFSKYDMVLAASHEYGEIMSNPGMTLHVSMLDPYKTHTKACCRESIAPPIRETIEVPVPSVDLGMIAVPLLDWEEYVRFRKSWIYKTWRRLNG